MKPRTPIITLLTDFGVSDEYVGVMKGVILQHCPNTQLVDICHTIPPHDIAVGARMIAHAYPFFPKHSVHLCVVDPGVGGNRDILLVEADHHIFIAPDNGLLSPLITLHTDAQCFKLLEKFTRASSTTFHGRDIMAPIAGMIASENRPLNNYGRTVAPENCEKLTLPTATKEKDKLIGEVLSIDHFGNICTSISRDDLPENSLSLCIHIGDVIISGVSKTYGEVPQGEMLAVIDSRGLLEISMNQGNAAVHLQAKKGQKVEVRTGR